MNRTLKPLLTLPLIALFASCITPSSLPDSQRTQFSLEYEGKILYLRSSMNVMPFFSDNSKRLVSPWPDDSVELLLDSKGQPILPGATEKVLKLGTKVRVDRVEFATGMAFARRALYTPSSNPWIYLSIPGTPSGRPLIAVLRAGIKSREEFLAAMNDLFTEDDPTSWMDKYTSEIRRAIEEKRLMLGMDTDAAALAWGRPEQIRQAAENGVRVETWTWPLKKRTAIFRDGKLASTNPPIQ